MLVQIVKLLTHMPERIYIHKTFHLISRRCAFTYMFHPYICQEGFINFFLQKILRLSYTEIATCVCVCVCVCVSSQVLPQRFICCAFTNSIYLFGSCLFWQGECRKGCELLFPPFSLAFHQSCSACLKHCHNHPEIQSRAACHHGHLEQLN